MFASVFAAPSTVYVTPTDLKGWAPSDVRTGGTVEISNEMTDKTGGDASLKLALADTTAKAGYSVTGNFGAANNVTNLSFDWYRASTDTARKNLTPVVGVMVDNGRGDSWLLKWEGAYNGYDTTVPVDQWMSENLTSGNFWRIPQYQNGVLVGFSNGCSNATPTNDPYGCLVYNRSLSDEWLAGYNVVGLEVSAGSGWGGSYLSYVDNVAINDTTFNFELDQAEPEPVVAATKEQCKNGGWLNVVREDSSSFKNQGQCVAYVESNLNSKHHRAAVQ